MQDPLPGGSFFDSTSSQPASPAVLSSNPTDRSLAAMRYPDYRSPRSASPPPQLNLCPVWRAGFWMVGAIQSNQVPRPEVIPNRIGHVSEAGSLCRQQPSQRPSLRVRSRKGRGPARESSVDSSACSFVLLFIKLEIDFVGDPDRNRLAVLFRRGEFVIPTSLHR